MSQTKRNRASLNKEQTKMYLDYLHSNLPKNPTATNQPYVLPFKLSDNVIYQKDLVVVLQRIADHMGYYLLILKNAKVFYYDVPINGNENIFTCDSNGSIFLHENKNDVAGLYQNINRDVNLITIHKKKGYKIKHLIGILVHEMMHHYLDYYKIRKSNTDENEILTDLVSAYLGMGHLILEAYAEIEWITDLWEKDGQKGHTLHQTWLGYVDTETMRNAISISTELRKLNPRDTLNSIISFSDRSIIQRKLLKYRYLILKKKFHQTIEYLKNIGRRKYSKIEMKLPSIITKHGYLVNKGKFLDKVNLELVNKEDGKKIVSLINNLSIGKFENELLSIKSSLDKNKSLKVEETLRKLNELELQIDEGIKLFNKYV